MSITLTVPEDSDGVRLDRFLASIIADRSRSQIQRLIKGGQIRVGGREVKANQPVKTGQDVTVDLQIGAKILEATCGRATGKDDEKLHKAASTLTAKTALAESLDKIVARYPRGYTGALMRWGLPWGDLVMMRRQLLNLKALAEGERRE